MSGVTKSVFGSSGPKYNQQQATTSQDYGFTSPYGAKQLRRQADGSYAYDIKVNDADKLRDQLAMQGLRGISLDPTEVENTYYQRATRQLMPEFSRQTEGLDENLINRGIQVGTPQYERAMQQLRDQQSGQLSDISSDAVFQGQNLLNNQISNINTLTGGRDINQMLNIGGQGNSYDQAYNAKQYNEAMRQQRNSGILGLAGGLAGMFSDERLKENLVKVGKLDNGLNVYIGNYKPETGLDTTPQLFLIAQEVQEINPDAVEEHCGYLAVDYKKAVQNG